MDPVQVYECLCDRTRLRILNLLRRGPLCACHFEELLEVQTGTLSRELGYLARHGMLVAEQDGDWIVYRLPDRPHPLLTEKLKCLQDLRGEDAVYRTDLERLEAIDVSAAAETRVAHSGDDGGLPSVLVLCTGNSCRSHMAEGLLREMAGDLFKVHSAGAEPAGYVHPLAVEVMAEEGIDIASHRSKHLLEFMDRVITTVITVCGNASDKCPVFPGQMNRYHWEFVDPARAEGGEDEKRVVFREVRDQIRSVLEAYVAGYRERFGEVVR